MFGGHNAFRFTMDWFYSSRFFPAVQHLAKRISSW